MPKFFWVKKTYEFLSGLTKCIFRFKLEYCNEIVKIVGIQMFCFKDATYYMENGIFFYHEFLEAQLIVQFGMSKI